MFKLPFMNKNEKKEFPLKKGYTYNPPPANLPEPNPPVIRPKKPAR